jgi:AGZA family xanthine/uracil permease-like MFS transporter
LIVLDGIVTLLLVLAGLREAVMNAIPRDLRLATGAGIGLFIAFIGLVNAKFVLIDIPDVPVAPGSLRNPSTWIALIGLLVTGALLARKITGALIIGIVLTTVIALVVGLAKLPSGFELPTFNDLAFHADVRGALKWNLLPLLFSVIMVDFFDTLGTATAIAVEAKLADERGRIPRVRRILIVDSISASIGGLLGVSSVTSYIESAAGVAEGARTGLHSVFVGIFFLLAIGLAPIMSIVPPAATAPALILVGFLMISQLAKIDFTNVPSAIAAFIILITIPMTYSIAHGIGYGFIAYTAINLLAGRWRAVHPLMYVVAAVFAAYFVLT